MDDALEAAGLWSIKGYIQKRQAAIVHKVACSPNDELCTGAECMIKCSWLVSWRDLDVGHKEE